MQNSWRDIGEGILGAAHIAATFATPLLRKTRRHWGLRAQEAARPHFGDALVPRPRWQWTHAIDIDAPAAAVWPWVVQLGRRRGGFYSYQWLENLVGCDIQNAQSVLPQFQQIKPGETLSLHPKMPPLAIVALQPGRAFVCHSRLDLDTNVAIELDAPTPRRYASLSWLFQIEPRGESRSRLISRFRCDYSDDSDARLLFGPALLEPIGFVMDRKMLHGIKQRAEASRR